MAVVVIVKEAGPGADLVSPPYPGPAGDVGEGSVAVVVVKDVLAIVAHVEVLVAVVVVVGYATPRP